MSTAESPARLPTHWIRIPFDLVFRNVTSSTLKLPANKYLSIGRFPVIDQGERFVGGFTDDETLVHPGPVPAVVFGDHTRCVKLAHTRFVQGADGVKVLAPSPAIDPKFAYWALRQADIPSKGYARHFSLARMLDFPLPPSGEQRRIVEAIESYFTRLDDAVATLERVQRNLKRYRASVLKAAVEGRLVPTEAELARAEGRDYEPASVLLERILAERRRRWEEAELAKMTAKGKPPKDDRWKEKYTEPVAPETGELPEPPEGWCWASVDQLGEVSGGITQNAKREQLPLQVPFLRVANVYANELRLDEVKTIGISESELSRVLLASGDLLVVEGNGSIEQIGRVALWDGSIDPCLHQNHIIKIRFSLDGLPRWTLCWLLAPLGRTAIERAASSTSGLNTLSLSKVGRLPVPLAPVAEQVRATAEVDRLTTLALTAEQAVTANAQRCARLRQSILKWAFEGRLVDQDPADEPASTLLKRIAAELDATTSAKPSRKRTTKKDRMRRP
ncbi:MAG: hypothetical protein HY812_16110 [Planctomycetes bacterium]|nr:hypothetical protein [Planctomycetota bacterium]